MKTLFIALALLTSAQALAALPSKIFITPCRKELQTQLTKWESKDQWIEKAPSQNKALHFTTPTKTFGRWLAVHAYKNGSFLLQSQQWTWQESVEISKACKVTKPLRHMASVFSSELAWSDRDLQGITKSNRPTLVYIWSPGAADSVEKHQTFVKAARDLKMNFVSMLDPESEMAYARYSLRGTRKAEEYLSTRRLHALELIQRNGTAEFPTAFVIRKRTISSPIVGVHDSDSLKQKIQVHLNR